MVTLRRLALSILLLLPLVGGCGTEKDVERYGGEVQRDLEGYLPKLGQAYATGDLDGLRGWATEKEIASLEKRIMERAAEGKVLEPKLRSVRIEGLDVAPDGSAVARTIEIWDLELYATGTRALLDQSLKQRNRVRYQLKLEGERWIVHSREVEKVFE